MEVLQSIVEWFRDFFGVGDLLKIINSGNYSQLLTYDGALAIARPLFPLLLAIELLKALIMKKFRAGEYKIPFFSYVFNAFVGIFIKVAVVTFCIGLFERFAIFKTTFTWYWFIYGYVVWEFGHFIYHYLGHKVRLFWCLHSTHHAPEHMNLSVSYAHFFFEGAYADFIRTTTCILLGVNPPMLVLIMFIDGAWGGFIHVGENLLKNGRLGFLEKYILTPSHHRVHHAKNPLYMDTNFCNLLNIWDRVFRTYQPQQDSVPVTYGITREMRKNSFLDSYFGEFIALGKDVYAAPGLRNKFLYLVMPPGWSHTGEHKTAHKVKEEYFKQIQEEVSEKPKRLKAEAVE